VKMLLSDSFIAYKLTKQFTKRTIISSKEEFLNDEVLKKYIFI